MTMTEWELTATDRDGRSLAVIVRAGSAATVADLRRALDEAGYAYHLDGYLPVTLLSNLDFVHGGGFRRWVRVPEREGGRELAAIGGRGAGVSAMLSRTVTIGRSAGCDLRLSDPEVSRIHATLTSEGVLADAGSSNGVIFSGYRLSAPAELETGDAFELGETVIGVRELDPADAPIEPPSGDGVLRYNRPPRIPAQDRTPEFTAPAKPEKPKGVRIPLLAALLPLLLGAVIWVIFPAASYFLIFFALSPLLLIAHFVSDRRSGRREYRDALRDYETRHAEIARELESLAVAQGRHDRRAEPDPVLVRRIATGPTRRLFERRPGDPDFLRLRIGLGHRPVSARVGGPGAADVVVPNILHAPTALDIAEAGVIGIAGRREPVIALARACLTQLSTLHAPHDLGIVVITGQDRAAEWEWAAWQPHTLPHSPDFACRRLLATDAHQAASRIAELRRTIEDRLADQRSALRQSGPIGRRLLVVVDGSRQLRALPGLAEVLAQGPDAGIYALCVDSTEQNLPDECRATVVVDGVRATVSRPNGARETDVLADQLSQVDALTIARALAPLRVLGGRFGGGGADLPGTVRYLEWTAIGTQPQPSDILEGWKTEETAALLGASADQPVKVDLRRDGPHALVAGTTGAGKSELLQTLVVSLALANPPDALNFVLVDYKGGSAFAECRELPHVVGMVTDLDGHLVNRALASLSAELRRRETILAEAEAKDIDDYLAKGGRMARLAIVIDEFASLLEEVPEFVTGIVGIGNRGRSLGVHIVLATQRPGGKVGADLRANLNLRICLRVNSSEESVDVIEVPDAARLSRHRPGRAYVRAGHGDLTAFQTARIGWPRGAQADPAAVTVLPWRVSDLGRAPVTESSMPAGHAGETDLTVTVRAIREAAAMAGHGSPRSPWLPPLPELVTLTDLPPTDGLALHIGLSDLPAQQAQPAFALDLERAGAVAVVGMARSGRSTLLRTIAATLPGDAHLYVLDQGNRALAPLAELPNCGAYVEADDVDRTQRVLSYLESEVTRRAGPAQPYLVLLLDQHEAFVKRYSEVDNGALVDTLEGLLRRGPAAGVFTVLATDRSGFGYKLAGAIGTRLIMRHASPDEYSNYGVNPREAPRHMPAGRFVAVPGMVEVQAAIGNPIPRPSETLPHRIDPLPTSITTEELESLRTQARDDRPLWCAVGAGGDHLSPVDVNLADLGHTFLIAGRTASGRSTALMAIAQSLTGDLPVFVSCPRHSPLADLNGVTVLEGSATPPTDRPIALFVDDAELLADAPWEEFARHARDTASVIVAAGNLDDLQVHRYRGWLNLVRRNRSGLLLNPATRADGDLFDMQLSRSTNGGWPAGRALLIRHGTIATTIQVPI
ncbi:FtsK/SpoIIIE domain-containing protein [Allorhizocola rhizosphaerae]|uniref:FtsK/SpoIIIE domain-containing protein n=1 Tax=Allorhizocola rhizosphaerae TaxID=1872709 RepID=UPI001B8B68BC|nr:FtsK/SpoIIIE domain-containing protein [Allorhizocola rhizosphaerae]